jgi:uncharacterized Ntn-hydrolase superfamily protein
VTYSIVARDEVSGAMGIGCESHFFAPGASVTWAEPGVGVVATQSFVDPRYGHFGLVGLREGRRGADILVELCANDPNSQVRQVALVGANGDAATWTGENCIGFAASISEGPVAVAGNMLANADVIPAMLAAYQSSLPSASGSTGLGERILRAMRAAEDAGGDVRGSQGAVLVVVDRERTAEPWAHRPIDLRVDDARDPIGELHRLFILRQAFDPVYATIMAPGLMVGEFHEPMPGDLDRAAAALTNSAVVVGANQEARFWHAILLVRAGRTDDARILFKAATRVVPALSKLADKLVAAGILSEAQRNMLR